MVEGIGDGCLCSFATTREEGTEAEHWSCGSDDLEEHAAVVVAVSRDGATVKVENGEKRGSILPEERPTDAEEAAELGCELNDDGDKERQFMITVIESSELVDNVCCE